MSFRHHHAAGRTADAAARPPAIELHTAEAVDGANLGNRHYTDACHTDECKTIDPARNFLGFAAGS
jgi:hypothetical protein